MKKRVFKIGLIVGAVGLALSILLATIGCETKKVDVVEEVEEVEEELYPTPAIPEAFSQGGK